MVAPYNKLLASHADEPVSDYSEKRTDHNKQHFRSEYALEFFCDRLGLFIHASTLFFSSSIGKTATRNLSGFAHIRTTSAVNLLRAARDKQPPSSRRRRVPCRSRDAD
jgi:hypothetical protein